VTCEENPQMGVILQGKRHDKKTRNLEKKKQQKQKDKKLFRKKCQNFFNKLIKILIGSDTTKKSNYGVRESK
jgi:hypothetical protein